MGNFEKIIIKKERDKIRRETLGKFFFDLAKLVFAAIVLGEILLLQENSSRRHACTAKRQSHLSFDHWNGQRKIRCYTDGTGYDRTGLYRNWKF